MFSHTTKETPLRPPTRRLMHPFLLCDKDEDYCLWSVVVGYHSDEEQLEEVLLYYLFHNDCAIRQVRDWIGDDMGDSYYIKEVSALGSVRMIGANSGSAEMET